jgi:hypothetical protein
MSLTGAGLIAVAISFVLFITAAVWYAAPWMKRQPLAIALSLPLCTRFVTSLQVFSAQHFGLRISDSLAN